MGSLIDVIKEDLAGPVKEFSEGVLTGAFKAIYTPFFYATSCSKITFFNKEDNRSALTCGADSAFHLIGGLVTPCYLFVEASSRGYTKELIGVLAVTNAVDYLIGARKRAKNKKDEENRNHVLRLVRDDE